MTKAITGSGFVVADDALVHVRRVRKLGVWFDLGSGGLLHVQANILSLRDGSGEYCLEAKIGHAGEKTVGL